MKKRRLSVTFEVPVTSAEQATPDLVVATIIQGYNSLLASLTAMGKGPFVDSGEYQVGDAMIDPSTIAGAVWLGEPDEETRTPAERQAAVIENGTKWVRDLIGREAEAFLRSQE